MTGTLAYVFIVAAFVCIVAGVTAVARTRHATRVEEDEFGDGEATYAEETAAVKAAEEAAARRDQPETEGPPS